jgi:hypothetical protein
MEPTLIRLMGGPASREIVRSELTCMALGVCFGVVGAGLSCRENAGPAQSASERTALVAQPCRGLAVGSEPLDPAKARVFVEVAEVSTRELPQPVGRWLDENAVKVRSTANLLAFPNVATSMPWGPCVDAVCSASKLTLTLTARLPGRASEPIELALNIAASAAEGSDAEPRVLLDTTVRAINQEPLVLPPAPDVSDGAVIVTAYLLQRHDDLQRVMECKVLQAEREKKVQ